MTVVLPENNEGILSKGCENTFPNIELMLLWRKICPVHYAATRKTKSVPFLRFNSVGPPQIDLLSGVGRGVCESWAQGEGVHGTADGAPPRGGEGSLPQLSRYIDYQI